MVLDGRVRDLDRLGNNAADEAADFGRTRVPVHVIDARRNFVGVCSRWYPVVRHLHRFLLLLLGLLLIMMVAVVLRQTLLFGLLDLYPRGPGFFMRFAILLFYLVLLVFGMEDWVSFGVSGITAEDVRVWPYSVSLLVKVSAFLGTLHWPTGAVDFGVGGVSFVEMLILYELWAGERLCLESATPQASEGWTSNFSVGCSFWSRH